MEKNTRARIIVAHVLRLDDRFGKGGPPRSSYTSNPSRLISDNCRWNARVSRSYYDDGSGKLWDMLELEAYDIHRLTVVFHEEELVIRNYLPGPWEEIFLGFDPQDSTPILPN